MSIFAALPSSPAASALDALSPLANPSKNKAAGKVSSAATTAGPGSTGSGTTGSDAFSVNNLGSTFLNLLVQELQNQDPTSPMDPTAMVGQMISLNQLSQLISINSALTPAAAGASPSAHAVGAIGSSAAANASAAAIQASLAAMSPATAAPPDSATTLGGAPSPTLNAGAIPAGSAAAAIAYGRGLIQGTPSEPLDLSRFKFISGGK